MRILNHLRKPITLVTVFFLLSGFLVVNTPIMALNMTENVYISTDVEEEIQQLVTEGDIPSLQAGIVFQDQLVWAKGYGLQPSLDTVYMIGSVQKTFTATSVLQLYEKGVIKDLEDDVNDYLPFEVRNPNYPTTPITIRMLLSHRSGLVHELPYKFFWDTEGTFYPKYRLTYKSGILDLSVEEFLNASLTPGGANYRSNIWLFEPGTEYSYSGSAFVLLKYLIEQVTNQSVANYMQENIFGPLGMKNTGFNASDFAGHHAIPYTRIGGTNHDLPVWSGQLMIRSTVSDMAQFLIAHINQGQNGDIQLLQPGTIDLMHAKISSWSAYRDPQWNSPYDYNLNAEGYGLGWEQFIDDIEGHGGSVPGYMALMYCKQTEKGPFGVIILINANGILGSEDDFAAVYKIVKTVRNVLLYELGLIGPKARLMTWLLVSGVLVLIAVTGVFVYKRRQRKNS